MSSNVASLAETALQRAVPSQVHDGPELHQAVNSLSSKADRARR